MSDRYISRGWDTCGDVWDLDTQRVVSTHALIRDAEAEAARLNAAEPQTARPAARWAVVRDRLMVSIHWTSQAAQREAALPGDRIARVRIEEIKE